MHEDFFRWAAGLAVTIAGFFAIKHIKTQDDRNDQQDKRIDRIEESLEKLTLLVTEIVQGDKLTRYRIEMLEKQRTRNAK